MSRGSDTVRAAVRGDDDVRTFCLINGAWLSEDCQPVTFHFGWQYIQAASNLSEIDCICSPELASRLSSMLLYARRNRRFNGICCM